MKGNQDTIESRCQIIHSITEHIVTAADRQPLNEIEHRTLYDLTELLLSAVQGLPNIVRKETGTIAEKTIWSD